MKLKTMIIDDDKVNREGLLWYLKFLGGFEIVHELCRFEKLEEIAAETEVDVAFVSVNLPGSDGFYCSHYLQKNFPDIRIVMMAETKDMAFEAYERGIFDYILKPLEPDRLEKTVARLKDVVRCEEATIEFPKNIMVKQKGKYQMISLAEILFLEMRAKKSYMILQDGTEILLQQYTMEQLEKMFSPFGFYRCYQSIIVQIAKISQLVADAESRNCTISIQGYEKKIPVSRDKFGEMVNLLQKNSGIMVTGTGRPKK